LSKAIPKSLGPIGRELWSELRAAYDFAPREQRLLLEACQTADELERLNVALRAAETVTEGSTGQAKPHPLFAEVRRHRVALAALVRQLEPPVSLSQMSAESEAGRHAAAGRWRGLRVNH
jgi:hypothetical protein